MSNGRYEVLSLVEKANTVKLEVILSWPSKRVPQNCTLKVLMKNERTKMMDY
jgi:hypothetical protein